MIRFSKEKVLLLHRIIAEATGGSVGVRDVKPYIRGEWYGRLADEAYFRAAKPDGFTVVWPDGQDLCPDELYQLSEVVS